VKRIAGWLAAFLLSGAGWVAILWIAVEIARAQTGSWRDMPPPRYQGTATAHVVYRDRENIQSWCGLRSIACYTMGVVFMPRQCGSRDGPQTVNVALMMRSMDYCSSLLAHEFGHVQGWPGHHPR